MSYEIVYKRVAIKVGEDQYVLLVQSGSNNCFEINCFGREVPEKDWFPYPIDGKEEEKFPIVSFNDVEAQLKSDREKYGLESGYFSLWKTRNRAWMTDDFCKWIRNAIKHSTTVEDLVRLNGPFQLISKRSSPDKERLIYTDMTNICTTAELMEYIQKAETDKDALGIVWKLSRNLKVSAYRKKGAENCC